nr:MAG TPA: hypothetical protein [Caudoviricetes sp.]DAN54237.1 MAG TPA: hypothetical protein [Caudoviricetes sp.]
MLFIGTTPYLGVVFFIPLSCLARTGNQNKKYSKKKQILYKRT